MTYQETVTKRLKRLLEQHPYLSIEFDGDAFSVLMGNRNPNILGNFAGGDMAYIANAAAGTQCVAEGVVAQTASINLECIARGDGELLVANAKIVHQGKRMIRLRCDVYVRKEGKDTLVAIAQINMSPFCDQAGAQQLLTE